MHGEREAITQDRITLKIPKGKKNFAVFSINHHKLNKKILPGRAYSIFDQPFDTVILQIPAEDVPLAEVLHLLFDLIVRFANRRVEQWGVTLVWTFAHAGL